MGDNICFNVDNEYDIPRDVINNECLCQITGRREVIVENYKRIKNISEEEIEVICKKYNIRVMGEKLIISYYNSDTMVIGGCVNEVLFVNLFFSCFEGKKFHYIVIKINENHIYRFINNTGKIKLRDIHSKDGITEIAFNYKDKNKVLDIAEKMGIKILDIKEKGTYTYITRLPVVKSVTFILAVFTLLLIINSHFIWILMWREITLYINSDYEVFKKDGNKIRE